MSYSLAVVTAPIAEPITLADAKQQCGIADDVAAHDDMLRGYIAAARGTAERYTSRQLMQATYDLKMPCFPRGANPIYIPRAPLQSVTSITYVDGAGDTQTLSTSIYKVLAAREPGLIVLKNSQIWPSTRDEADVITIRYVCGYASAEAIPEGLKLGMLMCVSDWFEGRSGETEIQPAVRWLWDSCSVGDEFHSYG
jgi:uncharacterized phiE125 gp8 family phage protein